MNGGPTGHEHTWSVVFLDMVGNNNDQSWIATCPECGLTERGDEAPRELGVEQWTGEPAQRRSDDRSDTP